MPRRMAAQLINTRRLARVPVPNTPPTASNAPSNPPTRDRRRGRISPVSCPEIWFPIYIKIFRRPRPRPRPHPYARCARLFPLPAVALRLANPEIVQQTDGLRARRARYLRTTHHAPNDLLRHDIAGGFATLIKCRSRRRRLTYSPARCRESLYNLAFCCCSVPEPPSSPPLRGGGKREAVKRQYFCSYLATRNWS